MEEENTKQGIHKAIIAVMQQVNHVEKTGHNKYHDFKYASESDLIKGLHSAMAKEGVFVYCLKIQNELEVQHGSFMGIYTYRFCHTDGSFIDVLAKGEAIDKTTKGVGDKAAYKAATGSLKYALKQTFLIDTGDNDPDIDSPENDKKGDKGNKGNKGNSKPLGKDTISDAQSKRFYAIAIKKYTDKGIKDYLTKRFKIDSSLKLKKGKDYEEAVLWAETKPEVKPKVESKVEPKVKDEALQVKDKLIDKLCENTLIVSGGDKIKAIQFLQKYSKNIKTSADLKKLGIKTLESLDKIVLTEIEKQMP